jgi:hypothetical protein
MSDKNNKSKKPSKMQELLNEIGIDETFTTKTKYKKQKNFDKVKSITFPMNGYNEMCDLLQLPTASQGFKYCLAMIDLWSNYCDLEPMKTKTSDATLQAMLRIFRRSYVKQPKASLKSDEGPEFEGSFSKWLKDHHIAHLKALPDRHSQLANINNYCKQAGRMFMTYLTNKEMSTKKDYNEWTDIVQKVRDGLNKIKDHPKDQDPYTTPLAPVTMKEKPKYSVDDIVYVPLEKPEGVHDKRWRMGDIRYDTTPRKVKFVLIYPKNYRYIVSHYPNVAYMESELKSATGETEEKWEVQAIRDKRKVGNKIEYLVKWKGYKVVESTWETRTELIKDGLQEMINEYEDSLKKPKKNVKK